MMLHVVVEFFLWLTGLCVGSFLNVVIYRLPAGLSIGKPVRSFCPRCRTEIAWFDNVPVLSWLLLGGRCRTCRTQISVQYPLVEVLTGLVFVLVYHLLFVAQARAGVPDATLPGDLPLLLLWLTLAAGMIACSAMDIVSYMVDVRITLVLVVAGLILHGAWPRSEMFEVTASGAGVAAGMLMLVVSTIMLWRASPTELDDDGAAHSAPVADADNIDTHYTESTLTRFGGLVLVVCCLLAPAALVLLRWRLITPTGADHDLIALACLLLLFLIIALIGGQQREADAEIHEVIEEEQPAARRTALAELLWLTPIIIAGILAVAGVLYVDTAGAVWRVMLGASPGYDFAPWAGICYAAFGAMVGAAAGWALRIVFTLAFGREAFGTGDIYILAAAGATGGWDIALLGLLLSIGVALVGWIIGLALKSTAMIPFGPWLAIGFVLALYCNHAAVRIAGEYGTNIRYAWERQPALVMAGVGLLLVATAAAMILARLVRQWALPDTDAAGSDDA